MTRSMRWVVWAILIAVLLFLLISVALFVFNTLLTTEGSDSAAFVAALR